MKRLLLLCLVACLAFVAIAEEQQKPPKLPQIFTLGYSMSLDFLVPNERILTGTHALAWPLGFMYWQFQENVSTSIPMELAFTLLSRPNISTQGIDLFSYLTQDRCWRVLQAPAPAQFTPLFIPDFAHNKGQIEIAGCPCTLWQWSYNGFFSIGFKIAVRNNDTMPMYFSIYAPGTPNFGIQIWANWGFVGVDYTIFNEPTGPCPDHSFDPFGNEKSRKRMSEMARNPLAALQELLPSALDSLLKLTPPTLHPFFSTDYVFGSGILDGKNKYTPPNPVFQGQAAADSKHNGYYLTFEEIAAQKIPWHVKSSLIFSPLNPGYLEGYMYYSEGRCWQSPNSVQSPDWPTQIPKNATFDGKVIVQGQKASLWRWPGSFQNYYGNITMAVALDTLNLLFAAVSSNYQKNGIYAVLTDFSSKQPDPSTFDPPQGPCPVVYNF